MLTWIQKGLPQFKDFECETLSSAENLILCKNAEWLPDSNISQMEKSIVFSVFQTIKRTSVPNFIRKDWIAFKKY